MTDVNIQGFVQQDVPRVFSEGVFAGLKANRRGELCTIDFYTQMAMEKRGFEVRAGIDTATATADYPVDTTKSEMLVDAVSGLTQIPVYLNVGIVSATGTTHQIYLGAVGTVSTSGSAFTPLPLWTDSAIAARTTARVQETGSCVGPADAVTTTNQLFHAGGAIATGAYTLNQTWKPLMPPICAGPSCVYLQIASLSIGEEYRASVHYIELMTMYIE